MEHLIYLPLGLSQKTHQIIQKIFKNKKTKSLRYLGLKFRGYHESSQRAQQALEASSYHSKIPSKIKYLLLKLQYNWARSLFESDKDSIAVTWNGVKGSRGVFMMAAKDAGSQTIFLENAYFNGYVAQDTQGINYSNSVPRWTDFYINWSMVNKCDLELLELTKQSLRSRERKTLKSIQYRSQSPIKKEKLFIFCPLQVEDDTQLLCYSPWIKNLSTYLDILNEASLVLPEGWQICIKEHPNSKKSIFEKFKSLRSSKLILDNNTDTLKLIELSQAVLCLNSSVGLQAFFYDKPVITLGQAFYSFGNMTYDFKNINDLKALISKPHKMTFNANLRRIFLNYLVQEYYVKI